MDYDFDRTLEVVILAEQLYVQRCIIKPVTMWVAACLLLELVGLSHKK